MIPKKPFDSYKWRWLSVAPTESLLEPPVFLGALRVFARYEGQSPTTPNIATELGIVQTETRTPVDLVRTPDRNLIRNSGQYWKGTGLLAPTHGTIRLTPFGHRVATGAITQSEFAAIMVQQTILPNPLTYRSTEIKKWERAGLRIRPLELILGIIAIAAKTGGMPDAYLTTNELIKIVIPLSGIQQEPSEIAKSILLFRKGRLDLTGWPDCAPDSNDVRLAREFLLFLANFGFLRLELNGRRDDQRFFLDEVFDAEAIAAPVIASIYDPSTAEQAVDEILQSPLPSIIDRQRVLASVLARPGQTKFREDVLLASDRQCLLTGEILLEVLEAAHIVPVKHGGSDEENNGLCLRVDVHRLFDSGHIRITPTGEIGLSDAVKSSTNYAILPKRVDIPGFINPTNLAWRHDYL